MCFNINSISTMEAATLKKKKNKEIKAKVKKTIKNVLSRPDPVFWPVVTEEQRQLLESIISKYKVTIPEFKKPHWKELKNIPKENRPKPAPIQKIKGLLFGTLECCAAVEKDECSGILIESSTRPQAIVQPVIEACIKSKVPVLCIRGLRDICLTNFGIKTICLGVKMQHLLDFSDKISELGKGRLLNYSPHTEDNLSHEIPLKQVKEINMDIDKSDNKNVYLYRSNKNTRVFVPPSKQNVSEGSKKFAGQNFIEFSGKQSQEKRKYLKMMVKKMSNNQNRVKKMSNNQNRVKKGSIK